MSSSEQHRFHCRALIYIILLLTIATSFGTSFVIPSEQNKSTLAARKCNDQGRCPPDTFWSLIAGTADVMATCCPRGYKAESARDDQIPTLMTFFCCPESTKNLPCPADERELTSAPETCTCNSIRVGSQCAGGQLTRVSSAVERLGLPDIWTLLGAWLLVNLV